MTNPKILIVDDEPFNVDYIEQELEGLEYELSVAHNGREALEKVQSGAPDLILLDIMMPVMDGYEVLTQLKAHPTLRDVPVIVISASSDLGSVVKGIQLGAEDYLPKPFEPILLQARITSSLEKKRLRDLQRLYLKSLEREIEIAQEIQKSFLPLELPRVTGWEVAAYFKAAREVAGDFYDAFQLPDGNLMCVIGDVCGKGVGAALFMTLFRSLIRAAATTDIFCGEEDGRSPTTVERLSRIVSFTNNYIVETHGDTNMFATVFIGIFDRQRGQLTYANCGNEPPMLAHNGGRVVSLRPTGPVLGIIANAGFHVQELPMAVQDLLLVFTDGIPDALNAEGRSFGKERLLKILGEGHLSPDALLQRVEAELDEHIGAARQFDDITLLAVQRNP